jgi:hypothetical protein
MLKRLRQIPSTHF